MNGIAQVVSDSERAQERVSWLERIELRCAAAWASALASVTGSPAHAIATNEGEPPSDERDWRRAWIQVHALRDGVQTQFDYHLLKGGEGITSEI